MNSYSKVREREREEYALGDTRTKLDVKATKASTKSGSWSHMYDELRAVTDAALVNLSKVQMNRGPYSSLWPNSSTTIEAGKYNTGLQDKEIKRRGYTFNTKIWV